VFSQEKKKPKYVYKTADELIATGGKKKIKGTDSVLAKVKVIDMTGKEKRVLSGTVLFLSPPTDKCTSLQVGILDVTMEIHLKTLGAYTEDHHNIII